MSAVCRSCGADIFWAVTLAGASMPIDVEPADGGNVEVIGRRGDPRPGGVVETPVVAVRSDGQASLFAGPRYVSHFATCPNANDWRRR